MRKLSLLLGLLAVVGGAVWLVRARSSDGRELRRLMDEDALRLVRAGQM